MLQLSEREKLQRVTLEVLRCLDYGWASSRAVEKISSLSDQDVAYIMKVLNDEFSH